MMKDILDKNDTRFITVAMSDTNGLLRGQKVSRKSFEGILHAGMGMSPVTLALDPTDEILNLPGVSDDSADFHDSPLAVDTDTVRSIPWEVPGHDLLVLSNYTGETAAMCPRAMLSGLIDKADSMGLSLKYGLELEYTLFEETSESIAAKGFCDLTPATVHASHDLVIYQTAQSEWYTAVADMCDALKIDLAKMHEEIGPGFMEACTGAGGGLEPADQTILLKNFMRALAMRQNKTITYMARWSEQADSQSAHIHVSLKGEDGTPLFWDETKPDNMSDTFRYFIGGMQTYIGQMMLLFAPTVNSYRRFAPGTFAPPALTWGIENRTTCFRVVGHDAGSLRVENRLPGSDANPYLTVAATLAAGLAGIAQKIEPDEAVSGNGYVPSEQEPRHYPRTIVHAIAALRESSFAREWLGDAFVDGFSATREAQEVAFQHMVPDTELRRFFELG
ncbi:glutamine synthetase [Rhodobacteraceae bacterium CY05]|uniref:Glutamine synthetase n=2 Tax=Parasedimentitalea huanghaiensis TaxID=2682100 RepID=A0A6L6WN26_9RHOB|nr:glutamine synthetase [Zongyanglinia huanghaiensis]